MNNLGAWRRLLEGEGGCDGCPLRERFAGLTLAPAMAISLAKKISRPAGNERIDFLRVHRGDFVF